MNVYYGSLPYVSASVVSIGAFDGVHRGHQKLIRQALEHAEELRVPLIVYTFDPPPKVYFQKMMRLCSLEEQLERFARLGVRHVVVQPFDSQYLRREAEDFHRDLEALNPLALWVGPDFRYGSQRKGDINTLRNRFNVRVLEPVRCGFGEVISSSRIRSLLQNNQQAAAYDLLGWEFVG